MQAEAEAEVDETDHVAAVDEWTDHVEDACYEVSEDVCYEIDSQGDEHEVDMETDDSSPDPPGVSTLSWHFALIAMDSEVIETAFSESFTCHVAEHEVTKVYGSMTVIEIPRNMEIALNDPHFGYCWLLWPLRPSSRACSRRSTSSSTSRRSRRDAQC